MHNTTNLKKAAVVSLVIGSITGAGLYNSAMAGPIPVIDSANIAKQADTLAETIKIVTNTAMQIALQQKELAPLSGDVLDVHMTGWKQGLAAVLESVNKEGFFPEDKGVLEKILPKTSVGDLPQTVASERANDTTINENLSQKNQEMLQSYKTLMKELDASKKRLAALLEQNKNPEGQKQAMQIANAIAAERAHIDSISASLNALQAQHDILKHQAQVTKEENHKSTVEASVQAEKESIKGMLSKVESKGAIVDPFQTYGTLHF